MSKRSKTKTVEFGWVVKDPATGKYVDDDEHLVAIGSVEPFSAEQDAKNYRDQVAYYTNFMGLVVVKVRVTTEEI